VNGVLVDVDCPLVMDSTAFFNALGDYQHRSTATKT
jgi:hypothetical protein